MPGNSHADGQRTGHHGDPGTDPFVPSYIPPFNQMDLFTPMSPYDGEVLVDTEVTIMHDLNKILTQNNASPFL